MAEIRKLHKTETEFRDIPIDDIIEGGNVRSTYENIDELAASIERDGLLQPVVVVKQGDKYRLIAGHRRLRAFRLLRGQDKPSYILIPAIIKPSIESIDAAQLIENIQRDDLPDIDIERAIVALLGSGELTQEKAAARLNKSRDWIAKRMQAAFVRQRTKEDTSDLSTSAIGELATVSNEKIDRTVRDVKKKGGSKTIAREAAQKAKGQHPESKPTKKKTSVNYDVQIKAFLRQYKGKLSDATKMVLKNYIDTL